MYEMTQLFCYKLVFMAELLIAMHLSLAPLKKKRHAVLRILLTSLFDLGIAAAYPLASYTSWYTSLMFLALFLVATGSLRFVYEGKFKELLFFSITAYTLQHLSHELYALAGNLFSFLSTATMGMYGNAVLDLTHLQPRDYFYGLVYLDLYLLVYALFYFLFTRRQKGKKIEVTNLSILYLSALLLVIDIILNAVVVYIQDGYSRTYSIVTSLYNLLSCIMILYIQSSVINTKALENELKTTEHLLHLSQEQYAQSKENIQLINLKCHDLKHQIHEVGVQGKLPSSTLKEMENVIRIYDSTAHTGNEALDVILTEKSLYCQKNGIQLSCFADCSHLSFLEESDLYSLFGNAIDNAIEATAKLKDSQKRDITLRVRNINSFISIVIENYFEGPLLLDENHLPVTTKKDKNYHGFGMKSIRFIVDKYHGDLKTEARDDIFTLSILIPVPKEEEQKEKPA